MTSRTTISIDHAPAAAPAPLPAAPEKHRASAFDLVASTPWAIEPGMLDTIRAIAMREGDGVEAVEARQGRPLQNARTVTMRDGVAVVPITGPIFRYANLFTQISGATSLEVLSKDFTAALDDPTVKAIVLDINSPGGQAAGIGDFAQHVHAASKPVVAFVDGMAASAAYWIASAASSVVISKSGMAGNVGAVLGIDLRKDPTKGEIVSSQSPNKRPDLTTDAGRAQVQTLVDSLAQVFIDDVAAYRGMTSEAVIKDFNGGDMLTGAAAVAAGMADGLGTLEGVIAELQKATSTNTGSRQQLPLKGTMMTITDVTELRAAHPDLCTALVAALTADELKAGNPDLFAAIAAGERARIQSVEAQALPGHEALIATLKFDGKTTGPEAAVQVLGAERAALGDQHQRMRNAAPPPAPHAAAPTEGGTPDADDPRAQARAKWDQDADLRASFGGRFETYLAERMGPAYKPLSTAAA